MCRCSVQCKSVLTINDVKNLMTACEFMAARIVRVLLICTTSVIIRLTAAQEVDKLEVGIRFDREPSDLIAVAGKSGVLDCVVKSEFHGRPFITWMYNDSKIQDDDKHHRSVQKNGSLLFKKVGRKKKDVGIYRCLANTTNGFVLLSRPAVLKIAAISSFSSHPQNATAFVGETVRLSCQLNSVPAAKITWLYGDQPLPHQADRYDTTLPGVLYISNVQLTDAGEYRCFGVNTLMNETKTSNPGLLVIHDVTAGKKSVKVEFASPPLPKVITVREKEELILECAVSGLTNVDIVWSFKKPNQPENSSKYTSSEAKRRYNTLKKSSVGVRDNGTYTCIVYQEKSAIMSQSTFVNVITPPMIINLDRPKTVPLGQGVRFACDVEGHPEPTISWLHNGRPVTHGTRCYQKDNELVFVSSNPEDTGVYQCVATSACGVALAATRLTVNDAHKSPTPFGVQCSPLNSTMIYVSWNVADEEDADTQPPIRVKAPSADEDGMNLVSADADESGRTLKMVYTVAFHMTSENTKEEARITPEKSMILTGLNPNSNYSMYVRTYTGRSGSPPSENVFCSTLPEVVDSPSTSARMNDIPTNSLPGRIEPITLLSSTSQQPSLQLLQINRTTLEVSWEMEKPNIGNDVYKVVYKNENVEDPDHYVDVEFQQRNVTLYNLEPDANYTVSLNVIINGTLEGECANASIKLLSELNPPVNVTVQPLSNTSINVNWLHTSSLKIASYVIVCNEMNSNTTLDSAKQNPDQTEVNITNLKPDTVYSVLVRAFDVNGHYSSSNPVWTRTFPVLENVQFQPLINTSTHRISWLGSKRDARVNETYIVTCTLLKANQNCSLSGVIADGSTYHVDIAASNATTRYNVSVSANMADVMANMTEPMAKRFTKTINSLASRTDFLVSVNQSISKPPIDFVEILGFRLTNDQLLGVFIGIGLGGLFIVLCILTIYICKKRFDKHYRQVSTRPTIVSSDDKHEMKIFPKGSNGYRAHYSNGCGSNVNAQLLLLPSNGTYPNGYVPNTRIGENGRYYDLDTRTMRDEADKLLNSSSPMDETCLTLVEVAEHDNEGGDSGYCDRNHSQSPQTKDCDSVHRLRKCSDVTVDDGFCENELPGISGASPPKLQPMTS